MNLYRTKSFGRPRADTRRPGRKITNYNRAEESKDEVSRGEINRTGIYNDNSILQVI